MTAFTRLSSNLWHWEPWTSLDLGPRMLWLGLYTTAEAKRVVPGLWHGNIPTMADASHLPVDDTMKYLDNLLEVEMVEFDRKHRVLRMTKLPDAGEFPTSPGILESWWGRFSSVPQCAVRDAHVATIRWVLDTGAALVKKNQSKRPSGLHEEIWATTFGTVAIPLPRRRGMRRLVDADTGTDVQPSLFGGSRDPLRITAPTAIQSNPEPAPVCSAVPNEIKYLPLPETLSRPSPGGSRGGSGEGEGEGEGDLLLSFPEQRGADGGGSGEGNAEVKRPLLQLVPPPAVVPFTVDYLLELLRATLGGVWGVDPGEYRRLTGELDGLRRLGYDDSDFALLGDWMRAKGLSPRGAQDLLVCRGQLASAFSRAQAWREETNHLARQAAQRSADLRDALSEAGI